MNRRSLRNGLLLIVLVLALIPGLFAWGLLTSDDHSSVPPGSAAALPLTISAGIFLLGLAIFIWSLLSQPTLPRFLLVFFLGPGLLWFSGAALIGDPGVGGDLHRDLEIAAGSTAVLYPLYLALVWPAIYWAPLLYGQRPMAHLGRAVAIILGLSPLGFVLPDYVWPAAFADLAWAVPLVLVTNLVILVVTLLAASGAEGAWLEMKPSLRLAGGLLGLTLTLGLVLRFAPVFGPARQALVYFRQNHPQVEVRTPTRVERRAGRPRGSPDLFFVYLPSPEWVYRVKVTGGQVVDDGMRGFLAAQVASAWAAERGLRHGPLQVHNVVPDVPFPGAYTVILPGLPVLDAQVVVARDRVVLPPSQYLQLPPTVRADIADRLGTRPAAIRIEWVWEYEDGVAEVGFWDYGELRYGYAFMQDGLLLRVTELNKSQTPSPPHRSQ